MRILLLIVMLFILLSFQIKDDEVQFEIEGSSTCLNALQKYKAFYKMPNNTSKVFYSLVTTGATVINVEKEKNFLEFQVGEIGITEFKFLELTSNKPNKTLKTFSYKICK